MDDLDVKTREPDNPFPRTMRNAVLSTIVAVAIGIFLGNMLGSFFGTDESLLNTSNYSDRMSAARTMFTDADQLDSYSRTALLFKDMEGLKLYTSFGRDKVMALWEGEYVDAFTLFDDEEIRLSLLEMMNTEDALYGEETSAGEAIEDVYLRNVAVVDGVVCYYVYYDEMGFIGLAYAKDIDLESITTALPLTQTESGDYEWFIIYDMGD